MDVNYDKVYCSCFDCRRELYNEKNNKVPIMLNVQAIVIVITAISQLLYDNIINISILHLVMYARTCTNFIASNISSSAQTVPMAS